MRRHIFVLLAVLITTSLATAATPPNIVFILADDWGWGDLGCHDHAYVKTPHLDALAKQGTEFYQFTVASGVCSPSRTAMMTGHFPARYSVHGHFATVASHQKRGMPDWLDPKTTLLPRLLQDAGYATAHYGKWHLSNTMVKDAPLPSEYGYDEYGAYNCSGAQMPVHDDVARATKFIEQSVRQQKPFFVNLWVHEPHTPHYPKPEFLKKFAQLDEADRIYAAILAHADARIGELLATVEKLQVADNTLVIFTSDNGPERTGDRREVDDISTGRGLGTFASVGTTGGHRGRKRSLLQGGVGVPFIAKWPGKIKAGVIDDTTPMTAVDLLPTLCKIANVDLPDGYNPDGIDQSAALFGKASSKREQPIFWQWNTATKRGDNWPHLGVRQGDWKLLIGKDPQQVELFRFPSDRMEKNNLHAEHDADAERLRGLINTWKATLPAKPAEHCLSTERRAAATP